MSNRLLTDKEVQLLGQGYEEADHSCGGISLNEYLLNAQDAKTAEIVLKEVGDYIDRNLEWASEEDEMMWKSKLEALKKGEK